MYPRAIFYVKYYFKVTFSTQMRLATNDKNDSREVLIVL